jgi:hypothetical protein
MKGASMIRIEIKTVVELPETAAASFDDHAHEQILQREIERIAEDPIGYQELHECDVKVTSCFLDGPIASAYVEKTITYRGFLFGYPSPPTLEPNGFPGL